ncbi:MAG: hypothetical protein L3K10_05715 [Thermoplasmata archaeon]|nr:hypothetical protein [Thermoplasmata archaeon]
MSTPAYSAPVPGRPLGVAIIAVLLGLFGFFTLLGGILVAVLSNYGLALGQTNLFGVTGSVVGVVLIILGLIELAVAVGLWHLSMWALVVAVLVLLYEVLGPIISIALNKEGSGAVIGIIIPLLLLIYLVAVRRHFR